MNGDALEENGLQIGRGKVKSIITGVTLLNYTVNIMSGLVVTYTNDFLTWLILLQSVTDHWNFLLSMTALSKSVVFNILYVYAYSMYISFVNLEQPGLNIIAFIISQQLLLY